MPKKSPAVEPASQDVYALGLFVAQNDLPVFSDSASYQDHVEAFTVLDASLQRHRWAMAAVCASLERQPGLRDGLETVIQRFCYDVGISARTFRHMPRTYSIWHSIFTCGTQVPQVVPNPLNSYLSFTHFRLAAQAPDPMAAIVAAHDNEWTVERLAVYVRDVLSAHKGQEPTAPVALLPAHSRPAG